MNVGDFVRTKKGIAKIIGKLDNERFSYPGAWVTDTYLKIYDDTEYIYDEDIIKSSPQIIDLIEKNDYVNGYLVIEETYTYHDVTFISVDTQDSWGWGKGEMPIENIKTIVTHEQMETMQYRVEE